MMALRTIAYCFAGVEYDHGGYARFFYEWAAVFIISAIQIVALWPICMDRPRVALNDFSRQQMHAVAALYKAATK
jgi:heme exporter protein D